MSGNKTSQGGPREGKRPIDIAAELEVAHERLLWDAAALEALVCGPAVVPCSPARLERLATNLRAFARDLAAHFDLEEHGGFLDAVLARAPERRRQVETFADEHRDFARDLEALQALAGAAVEGDPGAERALSQGLRGLLARLHRHEQREHALVQDVFYGGSEGAASMGAAS